MEMSLHLSPYLVSVWVSCGENKIVSCGLNPTLFGCGQTISSSVYSLFFFFQLSFYGWYFSYVIMLHFVWHNNPFRRIMSECCFRLKSLTATGRGDKKKNPIIVIVIIIIIIRSRYIFLTPIIPKR